MLRLRAPEILPVFHCQPSDHTGIAKVGILELVVCAFVSMRDPRHQSSAVAAAVSAPYIG